MKLRVAKCESSQPTTPAGARQMKGLYALKPWFTGRLTPIVDAAVARKVSPDVFTAAGCGGGGRGREWPSPPGGGRWRRCSSC